MMIDSCVLLISPIWSSFLHFWWFSSSQGEKSQPSELSFSFALASMLMCFVQLQSPGVLLLPIYGVNSFWDEALLVSRRNSLDFSLSSYSLRMRMKRGRTYYYPIALRDCIIFVFLFFFVLFWGQYRPPRGCSLCSTAVANSVKVVRLCCCCCWSFHRHIIHTT